MAVLNYFQMMKEIQSILESELTDETKTANIGGLLIGIEQQMNGPAENPLIQIFLENRVAVPERQRLAAGKRTDYLITFSIWCYGFGLTTEDACRIRDMLIGNVEIALMKHRTLNGTVRASYLEGGEFTGADSKDVGFFRAGEIRLVADAHATY